MRFDLDDAYKYKNRPFHSATPLFHAPNLLLFLNYFSRTVEDGLEIASSQKLLLAMTCDVFFNSLLIIDIIDFDSPIPSSQYLSPTFV